MADLPLPDPRPRWLIGRSDMDRYFYRQLEDAKALAALQAEEYPGETVYVYEVRLVHTIKTEEIENA